MTDTNKPFQNRKRMTRLAEALTGKLSEYGDPIITDYKLFLETWKIYVERKTKYLRGDKPSLVTFRRTRDILKEEKIIDRDKDYGRMWRIIPNQDKTADEVVCIADQFCYISHISAMQRYGLTDRRPEALYLTQATPKSAREMIAKQITADFGNVSNDEEFEVPSIPATHHPKRVRRRPVRTKTTTHFGEWRSVRGTASRIASIP